MDGTISLTHGPHRLGHYTAQGAATDATQTAAREKLWEINLKPDISLATKTGHFSLLPTAWLDTGKFRQLNGQGYVPPSRLMNERLEGLFFGL